MAKKNVRCVVQGLIDLGDFEPIEAYEVERHSDGRIVLVPLPVSEAIDAYADAVEEAADARYAGRRFSQVFAPLMRSRAHLMQGPRPPVPDAAELERQAQARAARQARLDAIAAHPPGVTIRPIYADEWRELGLD